MKGGEMPTMLPRTLATSAALVSTLAAPAAWSHDFWIEPVAFRPTRSPVGLRLRVGDEFPGAPFPRDPAHIERFLVWGPRGEAAVPGLSGRDPAGYASLGRPGVYVIGYQSTWQRLVQAADKFDRYVAEEGLDAVLATRARTPSPGAPVTEMFSRCAKTLVTVGDPRATEHGPGAASGDHALGLPLEILVETNPYTAGSADPITVRLLYDGHPLAGTRVTARSNREPPNVVGARTDGDGRVTLHLPRRGFWLVRALHMRTAPIDSAADWQSLWASLTFDLGSPRTGGP
jgi:hypothetical protein